MKTTIALFLFCLVCGACNQPLLPVQPQVVSGFAHIPPPVVSSQVDSSESAAIPVRIDSIPVFENSVCDRCPGRCTVSTSEVEVHGVVTQQSYTMQCVLESEIGVMAPQTKSLEEFCQIIRFCDESSGTCMQSDCAGEHFAPVPYEPNIRPEHTSGYVAGSQGI